MPWLCCANLIKAAWSSVHWAFQTFPLHSSNVHLLLLQRLQRASAPRLALCGDHFEDTTINNADTNSRQAPQCNMYRRLLAPVYSGGLQTFSPQLRLQQTVCTASTASSRLLAAAGSWQDHDSPTGCAAALLLSACLSASCGASPFDTL